jgi:soluble cytochrome b562
MSLTKEQRDQISKLSDYRDRIVDDVYNLEHILKQYFPEEFDIAYQHWIPQIITALYENDKWLPRGQQTLQDTINRLNDIDQIETKKDQTVKKFI